MLHDLFSARRPARRPATQLRVETLEDRTTPAFMAPVTSDGAFLNVGDFNNDGRADLVVSDQTKTTFAVRLGNGDGTFRPAGPAVSVGLGGLATPAVGDFDGDGKRDIVVISDGDLVMLRGNGDGTLKTPVVTPSGTGQSFSSMQMADMNGDGRPDLVTKVTEAGRSAVNFYLRVMLAKSNGTFSSATNILIGGVIPHVMSKPVPAIHVADVDGDGDNDVLTIATFVGINSNNPSRILVNNGSGNLAVGNNVTGFDNARLTMGQLDGDGKADLIRDNMNGTSTIFVGKGNGKFTEKQTIALAGTPLVADVNGDGRQDLIAVDSTVGTVKVFVGNGNGTFQSPQTFTAGPAPLGNYFLGDVNGDGRPDLVLNGGSLLSVLLNDGIW